MPRTRASPKNALVIDDDPIAREHVASLLRRGGWSTKQLGSPIGATREIIALNIRLVVIDVQMPSMRGDKLAKLLRDNPSLPELAVLLISGNADPAYQRLAAEAAADGLLSKSDLETSLLRVVTRYLRERNIWVLPEGPAAEL